MVALRRGDVAAFDQAYQHYRARLFGFLLRLCGNRELAEDLLQETWLRLARHARRLDQNTQLGAWLFTVARNLYRSHRRWRLLAFGGSRYGEWAGQTCEPASPFELASAGELSVSLELALSSLPLRYREVLLLVAVERMEPAQAAAVLGIRGEALRQRLSRARAMLARRLELEPEVRRERPGEVMHGS